MAMSTMLEKLAKALGERMYGYVDPHDTPSTWRASMDLAREALITIRVPTEEMAQAGYEGMERANGVKPIGGMKTAYMSMIDEALK